MSKAKFAAAKELIEQKRYDEARAILKTIDDPLAAKWLLRLNELSPALPVIDGRRISQGEQDVARMKSYTSAVVIVIALYCVLFIPGLIANLLYYNEGRRMERVAGVSLPGVGALALLRRWMFILLLACLLILAASAIFLQQS